MSDYVVLVTPRSFAKADPAPLHLLAENGCEVIRLPMDGGALEQQLEEYLPQADGVIAGLEQYSAALIQRGKRLKVISRYGVGCDNVDVEAARKLGIRVTNTPGANSDSVADLAMALMLNAARNICPMDSAIRAGRLEKPISGVELWKKTLGVVGTGRIGKGVIQRARGFSMNILAYDAFPDQAFMDACGGHYVALDDLFRQADFITLHAPLSEETRNLVDARRLALMKKKAVLVNTARGGIVDEAALYQALIQRRIGAAALDAILEEPVCASPLAELSNCILTPHAGAATAEAAANMGMLAAENLLDVLHEQNCPYLL